jgi:hypothetical protein
MSMNLPGYIFGNLARLLTLAVQPDGILPAKSVRYFKVKFGHSRILPNARMLSGTASSLIAGWGMQMIRAETAIRSRAAQLEIVKNQQCVAQKVLDALQRVRFHLEPHGLN